MPIYYAAGLDIRLSTTDAALSTSSTIITRQGTEAKAAADHLEGLLSVGAILPEGDVEDGSEDRGLRFLGDAGVPFLFKTVRIDREVGWSEVISAVSSNETNDGDVDEPAKKFRTSLASDSDLSSLGPTPSSTPLGSVFKNSLRDTFTADKNSDTVETSDTEPHKIQATIEPADHHGRERSLPFRPKQRALSLFIKADPSRAFKRASYHGVTLDIKIDVFMNGQLVTSTFLPNRGKNAAGGNSLRVSGLRIDRCTEKAWLLKNLDSTSEHCRTEADQKNFSAGSSTIAETRWHKIAAAIKAEADKLGFDYKEDRPPVGEYLAALSTEEIPHVTSLLAGPNRSMYGVLDVVLSLGSGRKYQPSDGNLSAPQPLVNNSYGPHEEKAIHDSKLRLARMLKEMTNKEYFQLSPTINQIRSRLIASVVQASQIETISAETNDTTGSAPNVEPSNETQPELSARSLRSSSAAQEMQHVVATTSETQPEIKTPSESRIKQKSSLGFLEAALTSSPRLEKLCMRKQSAPESSFAELAHPSETYATSDCTKSDSVNNNENDGGGKRRKLLDSKPETSTPEPVHLKHHRTLSQSSMEYERSLFDVQAGFKRLAAEASTSDVTISGTTINRIIVDMNGSPIRDTTLVVPKKLTPPKMLAKPVQNQPPEKITTPEEFRSAVEARLVPNLSVSTKKKARSSSPLKNEIHLPPPPPPVVPRVPRLRGGAAESDIPPEIETHPSTTITNCSNALPDLIDSKMDPAGGDTTISTTVKATSKLAPKSKGPRSTASAWNKPFDIPELNKDCIVTYAAEAGQGIRQCRQERPGEFKEVEVLLGVRYLLIEGD